MIKKILPGAAALGIAVTGLAAASSAASTVVPTCQGSQLVLTAAGSQGAAGTLYDHWRLRNVGAECQLHGYVRAHNFRPDGRPEHTAVRHTGTASTVVLHHGRRASFDLGYTNPATLGCTPQQAPRMIITTPGSSAPILASHGEPACHGRLIGLPIVAGG